MKGPKTMAAVVGTFVVLAAGFAFADTALSPQNTSVTSDSTSTTEDTTSTTAATTTTEAEHEAEHVTRSTVGCPEGSTFKNHGEFVSSVAKSDDPASDDHGKDVAEAAHSECGKPVHDATENENESEDHDGDSHSENHGPSANSGSGSSGDHSGHGHGHDGGDDDDATTTTSGS